MCACHHVLFDVLLISTLKFASFRSLGQMLARPVCHVASPDWTGLDDIRIQFMML